VLVGDLGSEVIIAPFAESKPVDLLTKTDVCGANNYFPNENEIHFVVRGSCLVRVR
jgi:hypothetical protein